VLTIGCDCEYVVAGRFGGRYVDHGVVWLQPRLGGECDRSVDIFVEAELVTEVGVGGECVKCGWRGRRWRRRRLLADAVKRIVRSARRCARKRLPLAHNVRAAVCVFHCDASVRFSEACSCHVHRKPKCRPRSVAVGFGYSLQSGGGTRVRAVDDDVLRRRRWRGGRCTWADSIQVGRTAGAGERRQGRWVAVIAASATEWIVRRVHCRRVIPLPYVSACDGRRQTRGDFCEAVGRVARSCSINARVPVCRARVVAVLGHVGE
jgi:hypothetical protein